MLRSSWFKASQLNEIISCQLSAGSVNSTDTASQLGLEECLGKFMNEVLHAE